MTPLSVLTVDFRNKVRLTVNEFAHQEAELDAMLLDLTAPLRTKRVEAFRKLNEARRKARAARQSTVFTTAAKNRFEAAVFSLDTSHWSLENPPRMATLKVPGSGMSKDMVPESWGGRGFWIDSAASYKALISGSLEKLKDRHLAAFGIELDAPWGLQFQEWGNPHIHLLLTVPMNADGSEKLAASPTGKGARNARFNGLRYWEWLESNWSDILRIRGDITDPHEHGVATWLPRHDEVAPARGIDDYLGRFVGYIRLDNDGDHHAKRQQQVVPWQWRDEGKPQQVNFWGIAGFTNKRRAADAPQRFEIRTKAAERAIFRYLAKLADRERTFKEIDGVVVETSFWSTDRTRLRGGSLDRPCTEIEILELRRIISFFNKAEDIPAACATNDFPDVAYAEEPDLRAVMIAAADSAPSPWERDDWDFAAFLAAYDDDPHEEPQNADEEVLSFEQLLIDCGFSTEEQEQSERAAKWRERRAQLAERRELADSEY